MKTNREKYDYYCGQIAEKDAIAITLCVPTPAPTVFYAIRKFEAVPVEVTHITRNRRGFFFERGPCRVSKAMLAEAMKVWSEWESPTLNDIFVHYRQKMDYGTLSGAHPYAKIGASSEMAWSAESLTPEIERRRALYEPRDGHKPCNYCQKQTPEAGMHSATIYYRERGQSCTKVGKYCGQSCAHADQCAHEG